MLCPYHGDYNDRLDRCPACVESRERCHAADTLVVPIEMTELTTLRARVAAAIELCERIKRNTVTLAVDGGHTRGYVEGMADAARDIRAKLEGR